MPRGHATPEPTGLGPTPAQTVGPFFGHALPFPAGGEIAPAGHPDAITVHGYVYDGHGEPVPDALLEFWQAAPDGSLAGTPGSWRRDPADGAFLGRDGLGFTGFGRVPTGADGHWSVRTLPPPPAAPYLAVCLFARGLSRHLFTRAYVEGLGGDAELTAIAGERGRTMLARREDAPHGGRPGRFRFDVHLQGEKETVFLDFHA
ncbi:protocatechuate 3,4-dioxygenase subunit alpha [Streptomyces sp. ASQP_92]|uniref:protocatechuate 3,4-dioxygenase subunit alpha n=1 Tax=Streptomyces sp. ASQP_92 TaxID=2979116 RepID=UPI0021BDFEDC|nr:protocatechuate 3,4-dioxygenase subunit alpha [Streptomyces sp. ASQP_92]MCT9091709.1 protocatechuate 3,4-dioxygenase subunit alpha [Streptomyces sp. ASQP_92]